MNRRTIQPRAAGLALIAALSCRGASPPPSAMKVTLVEPVFGSRVAGTVAVVADVVGGVDPVTVEVLVGGKVRTTVKEPPYVAAIDLSDQAGKTVRLGVAAHDRAGHESQDE